ncbi:MAG: hypothetical protein AB7E69_21115 [Sphingomonadales bacterium]
MRQAERYIEARKFDKAEAILRPLSSVSRPDDERAHVLYMLGITLGKQGADEEACMHLEQAYDLAARSGPEDTGYLVSVLRNWFLGLKEVGPDDEVSRVESMLDILTRKRTDELWAAEDDGDDLVHLPTTVRFARRFGALHRRSVGFDNPTGSDGYAIYTLEPPGRGKVVVEVAITDRSPKEGLIELSDRAVAIIGLAGADYQYGTFRAGLETKPTGIRRLWPFFDVEGEMWNLETFFVARDRLHISIFKTCPPGDVIQTGESLEQLLAQFDWPSGT